MSDEVFTVEEVSAKLRIHPKTLYAALRNPAAEGVIRIGRAIRIPRVTLDAWLCGKPLPGNPSSSKE